MIPHLKKILIVAGGTGGHIFPAQAFGAFLAQHNIDVHYVTDQRGQKFWNEQTLDTICAASPGSAYFKHPKNFIKLLRFLYATTIGAFQSWCILKQKRPDGVVGFGGYVTFPLLLVALLRGVPLWLHEQNVVLGKVNQIFLRWAKGLGWALPPLKQNPKTRIVGMPLRPSIKKTQPEKIYTPPLTKVCVYRNGQNVEDLSKNNVEDLSKDGGGYFRILILGGSQGAHALSTAIPEALANIPVALRQKLQIHHQVREEDQNTVCKAYHKIGLSPVLSPFFHDIGPLLAHAHLIISRAGAGTISEIHYFKKPMILAPYRFATENHQVLNCTQLFKKGLAWYIRDEKNLKEELAQIIKDLYNHPQALIRLAERVRQSINAPTHAAEENFLSFMYETLKEEQ